MGFNVPPVSVSQVENSTSAATAAAQGATDARSTRQKFALQKAAQEFESQLLTSIWKSMQGSLNPDDNDCDPAAGNIQDMQVQALCSGVASGGGMGIAKMITKDLDRKVKSGSEQ